MAKINIRTATEILETLTTEDGLHLVHFASPLYNGCKSVSQALAALSGEFEDLVSFNEVVLDMQQTELIQEFQIDRLPAILIFRCGLEVERIEELLSPEDLNQFLEDTVSFYLPASGRDQRNTN